MNNNLTIKLFGSVTLQIQGEEVKRFRSRKAICLMAFLACTQAIHRREFLADLLWDTPSTKQALSNLRTVLAMLRPQLNDFVQCSQTELGLTHQNRIDVDYLRLRNQICMAPYTLDEDSARQLAEALALYRGEFMEGLCLQNAPRFTEWLMNERRCIQNDVRVAYQKLAEFQLTNQDFVSGVTTVGHWLRMDPVDESAHAVLIEMLAQGGHRNAALAQYSACKSLLRQELDVEPAPEIRQLYERIKDSRIGESH